MFYVSRALIPVHEKVFVLVSDGYLYAFDREKKLSDPGNNDGIVVFTDLAGATVRQGSTSLGKSYGIIIKGNSMTLELDADSLIYQEEWLKVIQTEITSANVNLVMEGDHESNPGVVEWYKESLAKKAKSIKTLRKGTPMNKHYIAMGMHREHERLVNVDSDGQHLIWRGVKEGDGEEKNIPLSEVSAVLEGTRGPSLASLASDPNRAACCWTVVGDNRSVDFEAQTIDEKNRFVDNLRCIIDVSKLEARIEKKRRSRPLRRHN
jgi:hypothetical protein